MKKIIYLMMVGLLAGCASPKYTANFRYYKSNSGFAGGYGELKPKESVLTPAKPEILVASSGKEAGVITEHASIAASKPALTVVGKTYRQMGKAERREFRHDLKKEIKSYMKTRKAAGVESVKNTKAMDHDLKLAIIFGAIGLTLELFGGIDTVFWVLGVIAIVIGVVFLVKWLVRQ